MSASARKRIKEIVSASLPGWSNTKERLSTLEDSRFSDRSYYVKTDSRKFSGPVQSNIQQTELVVTVELGRVLAGGDALKFDIESLRDSLDSNGYNVSMSMCLPVNWDYSNTGIVIINQEEESTTKEDIEERCIVHSIEYVVVVRNPPNENGSGSEVVIP